MCNMIYLLLLFVCAASEVLGLQDNNDTSLLDADDLQTLAELEQFASGPKTSGWQVQVATRESSGSSGSGGWTPWSKWSTCSRTCDGGVSHQLRRCNSYSGCHGDPIRYKICNMQPCPDSRDFREHQCAAYNDVPYEGSLLRWSPHIAEAEPCVLTCRGHSAAPKTAPGVINAQNDDDEDSVVVQLAPKVQDGTRCRPGSLDMCINGKCERVGCDLRIGSTKKVDSCGVCGGDGTSCAQPLYMWHDGTFSLCSVSCGGGYKISRPVCRNRQTGSDADEQLCDGSTRPEAHVVACHQHRCPPRWAAAPWGPCTASCDGGKRMRAVHCLQIIENGTKIKVTEHACRGRKPRFEESCNTMECPNWHVDPWSGCSVSCGEGQQIRAISCRDNSGLDSTLCEPNAKPNALQSCRTGIACPGLTDSTDEDSTSGEITRVETAHNVYNQPPMVFPPPKAERLIGEQIVPSEATFITSEWGPCSCPEGIRRRDVNCKIFLEFSKTLAKLPDDKCMGPKPAEVERCPADYLCYGDPPVLPPKYSWKEVGYADCSASCLGGTQEMIIMCINEITQKPASPFMCSPKTKPDVKVRTCNDHPCPPRWNYSDFQPCTKSCGMGIQTRDVNCIHEITSGAGNTLVVPNSMCPQPPPPDRQYCNVLDCPIKWEVTEWSKCSKSCGGGLKERKVECKQVMAQNHIVDRPDNKCPKNKPPSKRPCNTKSCALESDRPYIATMNSSFIQHEATRNKVTAKVGGSATVFYGITLKIKCPVKRYDRNKIKWAKDQNYITKSKKYKISKKGALRIQNLAYRDSGIYTCIAGHSSADLTVSVKPRPGEFPSSEEIDHANRIEESGTPEAGDIIHHRNDAGSKSFVPGDDHSHEQRPGDGTGVYNKKERLKIWPTRPPARPTKPPMKDNGHMNKIDANPTNLGTTLFADQQGGAYNPGGSPRPEPEHWPANSPPPSASSSSRVMPHFQQLLTNIQKLWPFQTFSNSRGHRMISSRHEGGQSHGPSADLGAVDEEEDEEDKFGKMEIIGKGSAENLMFNWMITDWSECSLSCGGDGYQMRAAHCMLHLHNVTRDVNDNLCEDAGLEKPITVRPCGRETCPRWVVTEWTPCNRSRCFTWNTAMQRREVSCQTTTNSSDIDVSLCDPQERPPQRQECYNDKCKGAWRVGPWSECAARECEAQGLKYRILQCVWHGTKRAAGNACREQPRPAVVKVCKGPPCRIATKECTDKSKFCQNVKAMNMCRVPRYQYQCCQTCSGKG